MSIEEKIDPIFHYKQNLPQQLRGFYHVVAAGSFTAAAENMFLGQPTITQQVQALERELEIKLLVRRRGHITLTPEGRALLELAAPLVEGLESLRGAFKERLGQYEVGKVVCAVTEPVLLHLLPDIVREFRSRFPKLDLAFQCVTSLNAIEAVANGDADLAIGVLIQVPRNLLFQPLVSFGSFLVVPKDHPLAQKPHVRLEDIAEYPLIAPAEDGTLWQNMLPVLRKKPQDWRVVGWFDNAVVRLHYVASGLGVTFAVGVELAANAPPTLTWIPISEDLPLVTYGLMTRRNTYLSLAARRFADVVLNAAPTLQSLPGAAQDKA